MNAPIHTSDVVPPGDDGFDFDLEVWAARTIARAVLCFNGELGLHPAVDHSWQDAVKAGLVDEFGPDEVQRALALAFGSGR